MKSAPSAATICFLRSVALPFSMATRASWTRGNVRLTNSCHPLGIWGDTHGIRVWKKGWMTPSPAPCAQNRYLCELIRAAPTTTVPLVVAEEQLAAVGERQVTAVAGVGPILREESLNDDLGARRKRVLREPSPKQGVRRPALNHPLHGLAIGSLDLEMDPAVRIDPLHLCDDTLQFEWLVGIELRSEGVMGERGRGPQHDGHHEDCSRQHANYLRREGADRANTTVGGESRRAFFTCQAAPWPLQTRAGRRAPQPVFRL